MNPSHFPDVIVYLVTVQLAGERPTWAPGYHIRHNLETVNSTYCFVSITDTPVQRLAAICDCLARLDTRSINAAVTSFLRGKDL